ncbi:serine/threonine protein kinase [Streptacidiphilus cavernicola]|uniref:non-specific serine/threonine protein kinase n=1 Tax=Streptacidiphilus cavernicola TaxID=3342716 RepID=A0ABV6VN67_9ACTN
MQALESGDPQQVGGYRLLARLGAGGMGRVYLARSRGGRRVALKVIRAELADDPDFRARFAREVASARAVGGAFTVAVLDADAQAETPWLATEYVAGPALSQAVREHGPLPVESVRALAAGLAEALVAIHRAGVVHRDLKPSNVLLAADGPRVIDFGISRAVEATELTRTGVIVGSPGFMSPEQIEGSPVTPATDVFSLGAVLAYAASGAGPFGEGATPSLLYRVVHSEPRLEAVPEELRGLVGACLAKDPSARPGPGALLDRLEAEEDARGGGGADAHDPTALWLPAELTGMIAQVAAEQPLSGSGGTGGGSAVGGAGSGGSAVGSATADPRLPASAGGGTDARGAGAVGGAGAGPGNAAGGAGAPEDARPDTGSADPRVQAGSPAGAGAAASAGTGAAASSGPAAGVGPAVGAAGAGVGGGVAFATGAAEAPGTPGAGAETAETVPVPVAGDAATPPQGFGPAAALGAAGFAAEGARTPGPGRSATPPTPGPGPSANPPTAVPGGSVEGSATSRPGGSVGGPSTAAAGGFAAEGLSGGPGPGRNPAAPAGLRTTAQAAGGLAPQRKGPLVLGAALLVAAAVVGVVLANQGNGGSGRQGAGLPGPTASVTGPGSAAATPSDSAATTTSGASAATPQNSTAANTVYLTVPAVTDQPVDYAKQLLTDRGFPGGNIHVSYHCTQAGPGVYRQSPTAGSRVSVNTPVTLTAAEDDCIAYESYVGLPLTTAQADLKGFSNVTVVRACSGTSPVDTVLAQSPAASPEASYPPSQPITLTVQQDGCGGATPTGSATASP